MGRCKMTFGACQSTLGPVQDDPLNVSIDPWRVSAGAGRVLLRQNPPKSPENPHGDPFRPAGLIELALTHRHSVPRRDPWIIFYFLPADPSGGENPSRPFRSTSMGKGKISGEPNGSPPLKNTSSSGIRPPRPGQASSPPAAPPPLDGGFCFACGKTPPSK
jgi:hypothetical protein